MKAAEVREFGKQLMIRGSIDYEVGKAETPIGFVKVLEHALDRMDAVLEEERAYLARTEKRMTDLQAEVAKSFDKADRLEWLQQRQREIDAMLDLSKGDLAAADADEEKPAKAA